MPIPVRLLQHRRGFLCECDSPRIAPVTGRTADEALGRLVAANPHRFGIDLVVEHRSVHDLPDPANDVPPEAVIGAHAATDC